MARAGNANPSHVHPNHQRHRQTVRQGSPRWTEGSDNLVGVTHFGLLVLAGGQPSVEGDFEPVLDGPGLRRDFRHILGSIRQRSDDQLVRLPRT